MPPDAPHPPLRSYGRVRSRVIKPRQADLIRTLLPRLALPAPADGPIDLHALAPQASAVWLEIGFGGGEHMIAQAVRRPDVLMLGVEPFQNGMAGALRLIEEGGAANIRLHLGDARDLVAALPAVSLERLFILFPDPWPKARHHKRRLIQAETIAAFARVLKPGGRLRFATDWADYGDWTLRRFLASPDFRWPATGAADWTAPPEDHVVTRYQTKALGDIQPLFFDFERV